MLGVRAPFYLPGNQGRAAACPKPSTWQSGKSGCVPHSTYLATREERPRAPIHLPGNPGRAAASPNLPTWQPGKSGRVLQSTYLATRIERPRALVHLPGNPGRAAACQAPHTTRRTGWEGSGFMQRGSRTLCRELTPPSIVWLFRPHMYSLPDTETTRAMWRMVVAVVVMMKRRRRRRMEKAHASLCRVAVPPPHVLSLAGGATSIIFVATKVRLS